MREWIRYHTAKGTLHAKELLGNFNLYTFALGWSDLFEGGHQTKAHGWAWVGPSPFRTTAHGWIWVSLESGYEHEEWRRAIQQSSLHLTCQWKQQKGTICSYKKEIQRQSGRSVTSPARVFIGNWNSGPWTSYKLSMASWFHLAFKSNQPRTTTVGFTRSIRVQESQGWASVPLYLVSKDVMHG